MKKWKKPLLIASVVVSIGAWFAGMSLMLNVSSWYSLIMYAAEIYWFLFLIANERPRRRRSPEAHRKKF